MSDYLEITEKLNLKQALNTVVFVIFGGHRWRNVRSLLCKSALL